MDPDISDILASLSNPASSQSTTAYDPTTATTDHILLTRAWQSERCTLHLLPYPTTLLTRTLARIRDQITTIEDLTSGTSSHSNRDSKNDDDRDTNRNLNLVLSILQTDLGRTQFLLRSYLRQRLAKITRHAVYYLKHHTSSSSSQSHTTTNNNDSQTDTKTPLLSGPEISFLRHHQSLLSQLYDAAFLASLPAGLRRLDDATSGMRMEQGSDGAEGVVVRCLAGEFEGEDEGEAEEEGEGRRVVVNLRRGDVVIARWRDVRAGVLKGELEVL